MTLGGKDQNWSRALTVKSGQSSGALGAGTPASPRLELPLHLSAGDDAF